MFSFNTSKLLLSKHEGFAAASIPVLIWRDLRLCAHKKAGPPPSGNGPAF